MPLVVTQRPKVSCQTCPFYHPYSPAEMAAASNAPGEGGTVPTGECRNGPPSLIESEEGIDSGWPPVEASLWCGVHPELLVWIRAKYKDDFAVPGRAVAGATRT